MPQSRSGQVRKISPPTRIRSPDRPARSESLYLVRHPASKGKAIQLQAWKGPKDSKRLRLPDFKTVGT